MGWVSRACWALPTSRFMPWSATQLCNLTQVGH